MNPERQPASAVRARIWFFVRLLISLALVVWLVLAFDWYETWQAMAKISIWGIGALLLGLVLNRLLAFYRFWVLLDSEGILISLGTVTRLSFLATFASNFLPSTIGGDLAKIGWLASQGLSAWRMAIWTLFDRLSNMLAVGLLAPFCLLLPFIGAYTARWFGGWTPTPLVTLALFMILSLITGVALGFSPERAPHNDRPADLLAFKESQARGILQQLQALWSKVLSRKRIFGLLTLISMISIAPNLLGTWLAALDLGMQVSPLGVTAIYVVLYFITLLPISINGLGLQEISTVALYQSLGADESQAVALAILLRFAIWITTLPGAFWLGRGMTSLARASADQTPQRTSGRFSE